MDKPISIAAAGGTITNLYNSYGRCYSSTDPNAGTSSFEYNSLGEIINQEDAEGNAFQFTYDQMGRITEREDQNNNQIIYSYVTSGNGKGLISSISNNNSTEIDYTYNSLSQITQICETIEGNTYCKEMSYNQYGKLEQYTFPSDYILDYSYTSDGYLDEIYGNGNLICKTDKMTALGQAETIRFGNDCVTDYVYDNYFRLSNITIEDAYSNDLINLGFSFNANTGNLSSREDNINMITESFTYDNLNRLTATTIGSTTYSTYFSNNGNINSKTDIGNYSYDATKKHAVTTITGNQGSISDVQQNINYTTFNKISDITEGDYYAKFLYGPDDQRKRMTEEYDNNTTETYYLGNFEIVNDGESVKFYHYISGADGLDAIYICDKGSQDNGDMYYVGKDHLGSIIALINSDQNVVESFNYDAWGRRRNPTTWTFENVPDPELITRGYTAHEHLDDFQLINMNGRLYDPILGRMLSPDPVIQNPNSTQNYNRYSYCINNPLKYTDPSGDQYSGYDPAKTQTMIDKLNSSLWWKSYLWFEGMQNDADWSMLDALSHVDGGGGGGNPAALGGDKPEPVNPTSYTKEELVAMALFLHNMSHNAFGIINPFYGAVAIAGDFGFTFPSGEVDAGYFFILTGDDIGNFYPYKENGAGGCSDWAVGGELAGIWFTGNDKDFKTELLYGERTKVYVGANKGVLGVNLGVAWSPTKYGSLWTISFGANLGVSFLTIFLLVSMLEILYIK